MVIYAGKLAVRLAQRPKKIVLHLPCGRIALARLLAGGLHHNVAQCARNPWIEFRRRRYILLQMFKSNSHGVIPTERHLPCKHFIKHYCARINVRCGGDILSPCLLRRNIMHRPHNDVRSGERARGGRNVPRYAKIGQLRPAARGDYNVLRLNVAVYYSLLVRMGQRI